MWGQGGTATDAGAQWAQPGPWQTVRLAGQPLPGKAEVLGGSASRRVDVKNAPGADGAGITDRGLEPSRFKVRVTLWTAEHLAAWERRLPRIQPRAGKGGLQRASIYHPALAHLGITEVCITQVSALQPGSTVGTYVSEIDCLQWLPPGKNVTKTITKSTPSIPDVETSGDNYQLPNGQSVSVAPEASSVSPPSELESGPNYSTPAGQETTA
jgi:hypothetical protein